MELSASRLDSELAAWKRQFGAGMLTFDAAYGEARYIERRSEPEAQQAGAHALLDAFVGRLKDVLATETGGVQ